MVNATAHGHGAAGFFSYEYHHHLCHDLIPAVHLAKTYVCFAGSFVLAAGFILAALNFGLVMMNHMTGNKYPMIFTVSYASNNKQKEATFGEVRLQLGELTALGLEILVVSDILETLTKLETGEFSWDEIGKMVAIAILRTGLAYMLGKEIEEIKEHIEHEVHHDHDHHDNGHGEHHKVSHAHTEHHKEEKAVGDKEDKHETATKEEDSHKDDSNEDNVVRQRKNKSK